jgi:hypothetical protein
MKTPSKIFLLFLLLVLSCTKEKKYQYLVNDVSLNGDQGEKIHLKTTTEFISIAYADLFGTNIPQSKLVNLSIAYSSFGDYKVLEQRIISNFLADTTAIIPSSLSINGDTVLFVINTYKKFYNREPNELEKHYWKELIRTTSGVTPTTVYYAMMTSDEYRFY